MSYWSGVGHSFPTPHNSTFQKIFLKQIWQKKLFDQNHSLQKIYDQYLNTSFNLRYLNKCYANVSFFLTK